MGTITWTSWSKEGEPRGRDSSAAASSLSAAGTNKTEREGPRRSDLVAEGYFLCCRPTATNTPEISGSV
ncbi:unnamed protein product [Ascophyllum nodosum]